MYLLATIAENFITRSKIYQRVGMWSTDGEVDRQGKIEFSP